MNHQTTNKLFKFKFLSLIASLLICSSIGLQAKPPSEGEGQKACRSDVISYCKTEAMFGSKKEVQKCLRENDKKLSKECHEILHRADSFKAEMKANCEPQISQHCGQFEGDQSEMRNCIKNNVTKFSMKCQDFLKKNNESGKHIN